MDKDNRWWFANQPQPIRQQFENVVVAIVHALHALGQESSIEEIHWYLCLATTDGNKRISRRKISRELSRRTDLFQHISRAKYSLLQPQQNQFPRKVIPEPIISKVFEPAPLTMDFQYDFPQCETPPCVNNDIFDANDFFGLSFSCNFD